MKLNHHAWIPTAMVALPLLLAGCEGDTGPTGPAGPSGPVIPSVVLTSVNMNMDDAAAGPEGRSLLVLDVDTDTLHNFPLTTMAGGPSLGMPMHSAITPDKRTVYVTMSGNAVLDLRLLVIELDWAGGTPTPTITDSISLVPAGSGAQEGHGPAFTADGLYLLFSEMNNDRLRVLDTQTNLLVGAPTAHASLVNPHGLYPNPSGTLAMSTQYTFDANEVSIWDLDNTTGVISFNKTVALTDGPVSGAYSHTGFWLDDTRFYTNCTQELVQGSGIYQKSVWLVDAVAGTATVVLDDTDLLEGISDTLIANGKLYLAEGNVETGDPGAVSVWDIADPLNPVLVKQLTPGAGLPAGFLDAHGIFKTPDDKFVFVQAFRSDHLIKIHTSTDNVVRVYDGADGLSLPHGLFINY